jgi:hypothetical protein
MAIIIEDGSNVAGANSFISVSDVREYATVRGYVLTSTDPVIKGYIIRFMDWLYGLEGRMKGSRQYTDQNTPYPRTGVILDGVLIDDGVIPLNAKNAGCEYCILLENGINPMYTSDRAVEGVVSEKTPDFERQYSNTLFSKSTASTALPTVMTYMNPLLKQAYSYR